MRIYNGMNHTFCLRKRSKWGFAPSPNPFVKISKKDWEKKMKVTYGKTKRL